MPVLAQGNTANLTLGAHDSITLQNRAGQSASLTVAGTLVNGQHSGTRTYGPYTNGGAVVLVATAGDVYYEVADGAYAGVANALVEVDTQGRPIRTVTPDGQSVGGGGSARNEALRLFAANVQSTNASNLVYSGPTAGGYVDSLTTEVPGDADGFFLILANGSTTQQLTVAGINFRVAGSLADRPYNGVTAVAGSFNGAAGVVIPVAPSAALGSFVRSDTAWLSTVPRTDQPTSARRIVHVRVAYAAIGGDTTGTTPLSYWSRGGTRWTGAQPTGFETYAFVQAGGLATNIGNAGFQDGGSTIFGLGYISRGKVCVVGIAGDSFVEGFEEGSQGRSFGVEAVVAANQTGALYDYMAMGKGGDGIDAYTSRALAIMSLFKPTVLHHMSYSTNNGAASDPAIATQRQQTMRVLTYCQQNGVLYSGQNSMPRTNAGNTASTWDATGRQRQADYDNFLAGTLGVPVFDLGSLTRAGSGLWVAGATTDGIHVAQAFTTTSVVPSMASYFRSLPVVR